MDEAQPCLSWIVESARRAQKQTAYQILVSGSEASLKQDRGEFWDSGRVASDRTTQIRYGGKPLSSFQQLFWKVRVWDRDGRVSAWSPPASWSMGVLAGADWHAKWIGFRKDGLQSLLLRSEFSVRRGLKRAVACVCGLGQYEMSLNGRKVGEELLTPGWSKYDKTCLYDAYDITGMLGRGRNAVGLVLGNGMYNVAGGRYTKFEGSFGPLKAIAQLHLEYNDGATENIGTDDRWRTHPGPITFSCVFGGEDHDARLEQPGWDRPGFNPVQWEPALILDGPGDKLTGLSAAAPPVRAFDILKPIKVQQLRPGVTVYDLGQNASLIPRLDVKGPAGSVVRITPAELIAADGSVDRASCGGAKSKSFWQYTLAGCRRQSWFPKFFYHGCRYLLGALADGGRSDVIFDMNNQSERPGYGYQIKQGATSLPEAWDARRDSSQNHFMLGHTLGWFYRDLGGIACDPEEPGFKKILIRPWPMEGIRWVRASYASIRGRITTGWKMEGGTFRLDLTLPANTTATVFIPARAAAAVLGGGQSIEHAEGVKILRTEVGRVVLAVESGSYRFEAKAGR